MTTLSKTIIDEIKLKTTHKITDIQIDDLLNASLIDKQFNNSLFPEFLKEDLLDQEEEGTSLIRYIELFKRDMLLSFTDSTIGKDIPSLATNYVHDKFSHEFNNTRHIEYNNNLAKITSYLLSIFLNMAKTPTQKEEVEQLLTKLKEDLGKDHVAEGQFFTVFSLINNLIKVLIVDKNYQNFFSSLDSCLDKLKTYIKGSPFTLYLVNASVVDLSHAIVTHILQANLGEQLTKMGLKALLKLGSCFKIFDIHLEFIDQLITHDLNFNLKEEFSELIAQLYSYSLESAKKEEKITVEDSGLKEDNNGGMITFATDGKYIYAHQKQIGLVKIGTGRSNTQKGAVYARNKQFKLEHEGSLVYACGKLYFRSPLTKPFPFVAVDTSTLTEVPITFTQGQDIYHFIDQDPAPFNLSYTLQGHEIVEPLRMKAKSRIISEGRFIYLISKIGELKNNDKESEGLYPGNYLFNVDIFDPLQNCDYVSSFPIVDTKKLLPKSSTFANEAVVNDVITDGTVLQFMNQSGFVTYNMVARAFTNIDDSNIKKYNNYTLDSFNSQIIKFSLNNTSTLQITFDPIVTNIFQKDLTGEYVGFKSLVPAMISSHDMFLTSVNTIQVKGMLKDHFDFFCMGSKSQSGTHIEEKTYDKLTNSSILLALISQYAKVTLNFTELSKSNPMSHVFLPHILNINCTTLKKIVDVYKNLMDAFIKDHSVETQHFLISSMLTLLNAHLRQLTTLQFDRLPNFKSDFGFLQEVIEDCTFFIKELQFKGDHYSGLSVDLVSQSLQIVENYSTLFDIHYPNMNQILELITKSESHLTDLKRSALLTLPQSKAFEHQDKIDKLAELLEMILQRNENQIYEQLDDFLNTPVDSNPSFSIEYEKAYEGLITPFLKLLFNSSNRISNSANEDERRKATEDFILLVNNFDKILKVLISHLSQLVTTIDASVKKATIQNKENFDRIMKSLFNLTHYSSYAFRLSFATIYVFYILSKDKNVIFKTWHHFFDLLLVFDRSMMLCESLNQELEDKEDKEKGRDKYEIVDWVIETPHPVSREINGQLKREFTRPYNFSIEFDPFSTNREINLKFDVKTFDRNDEQSFRFPDGFQNLQISNVKSISASYSASASSNYGLKVYIHNRRTPIQIFGNLPSSTLGIIINAVKTFFFFNFSKGTHKEKELEEILQSKLFAGGIDELLDLQASSEEYKSFMSHLKGNKNFEVFERRLSNNEKEYFEDSEAVSFSIDQILKKENPAIEKFIDYAQSTLKPRYPWIVVGGENAGAIVRGAFAVLIKQEKLYELINDAVERITSLEDAKENKQKLTLEELSTIDNFEFLLLTWTEINRLRQWYMEQIKDLAEANNMNFEKQNEDFVKSIIDKCCFLFQLNASKGNRSVMKKTKLKYLELFAKTQILSIQKIDSDVVKTNAIKFKKNQVQGKIDESNAEMENTKKSIQSLVNCIKLTKISIESLRNAIQEMNTKAKFRETSLSLVNSILSEVQSSNFKLYIVKQIIYSLRLTSGKKLLSIDEEIRSASPSILAGITGRFHQFIQYIFGSLLTSDSVFWISALTDCLMWNYKARDHRILIEVGIFENLFISSPNEIIRKAWESLSQQKMKYAYHKYQNKYDFNSNLLCQQLVELFNILSTSVVGRVIEETHLTIDPNEQESGFFKKKSSVFDNSFEKLIEDISVIMDYRLEDCAAHYLDLIKNIPKYGDFMNKKDFEQAFTTEYFDETYLTVFLTLVYKFIVNRAQHILKYIKKPDFLSNLLIILRFTCTKNKHLLVNILKVYLNELKDEDIENTVIFLRKNELYTISREMSIFSDEVDEKIPPRTFICLYLLDSLTLLRKGLHDPQAVTFSSEYEEGAYLVNLMRFMYTDPLWMEVFDDIFLACLSALDFSRPKKVTSLSHILSVLNGDIDDIHYGSKVLMKYKSNYSKSIAERIKDKVEEKDSCASGYVLGFCEKETKIADLKNKEEVRQFFSNSLHTKRGGKDQFVVLLSIEKDTYSKNKLKSNDVEFQTRNIKDVIISPEIEVTILNHKLITVLTSRFNEFLNILSSKDHTLYDLYLLIQFSRAINFFLKTDSMEDKETLKSIIKFQHFDKILRILSSNPFTSTPVNENQVTNLMKLYLDSKTKAGFKLDESIESEKSTSPIKCTMLTNLKALRIFKSSRQNGQLLKIMCSNMTMNKDNSDKINTLQVVKFGDPRLKNYLNCLILVNLEQDDMADKIMRIDDINFAVLISNEHLDIALQKVVHPFIVVNSRYEQLEGLVTQLDCGQTFSNGMPIESCDESIRRVIEGIKVDKNIEKETRIPFMKCNSINVEEIVQEELGRMAIYPQKVSKGDIANYMQRLSKNYLRNFIIQLIAYNPECIRESNFDCISKQFKIAFVDICEASNLTIFSYKKFEFIMNLFPRLIEKEEEIRPKVKLLNLDMKTQIFNAFSFKVSENEICSNVQSELLDYFYETEFFKHANNPNLQDYYDLIVKLLKLVLITINYESKTFSQYLKKLHDTIIKLFSYLSSNSDTFSPNKVNEIILALRKEGLDQVFLYLSDSLGEEKSEISNRTKSLLNFTFDFGRLYTEMLKKGWTLSRSYSFEYVGKTVAGLLFSIGLLYYKTKFTELRDRSLFQSSEIINRLTSEVIIPYSTTPIEATFNFKDATSLRVNLKPKETRGKMLLCSELKKSGAYQIGKIVPDTDCSPFELFPGQKIILCGSDQIKQELWMCGSNETYRFGNDSIRDTTYYTPQKSTIDLTAMIKKIVVLPASTVVITVDNKVFVAGGGRNSGMPADRKTFTLESKWNDIAKTEKIIDFTVNTNNGSCMVTDKAVWVKGYSGNFSLGEAVDSGSEASDIIQWRSPFLSKNVCEVSMGYYHTIFRLNDGTCYGCGSNTDYQLALPTADNIRVLTKLNTTDNPCVKISCGYNLSLFLIKEGDGCQRLYSCGVEEYNGQGRGNDKQFKKITNVQEVQFKYCRVGYSSMLAISTEGKLYTWGNCGYNNLANEDTETKYQPKIADYYADKIVYEAEINERTLIVRALDIDGAVKIWISGYNGSGCLCQETSSNYNTKPLLLTAFGDSYIQKFYLEGSNYAISFVKSNLDIMSKPFEFKCSKCNIKKNSGMAIHQQTIMCLDCFKADQDVKVAFGVRGCVVSNVSNMQLPDLTEINNTGIKGPHSISCIDCKHVIGDSIAYIASDKIDTTSLVAFCENCYPYSGYFNVPKFVYLVKGEIDYCTLPVISNSDELLSLDYKDPYTFSQFRYLNDEGKKAFFDECGDTILANINKEYDDIRPEHIIEYIRAVENDPNQKNPEELKKVGSLTNLSLSQIKIIENIVSKIDQSIKDIRKYIFMDQENILKEIYISNLSYLSKAARTAFFELIIYEGSSSVDPSSCVLKLSRGKAIKFKQKIQVDYQGQYTIFGQIFTQLKNTPQRQFMGTKTNRLFKVELYGEGATDAGGPYREMVNIMCEELQSPWLDLFIPTPNNKSTSGQDREKWTINPAAKSSVYLEMFKIIGKLFGFAARSLGYLNFNLPSFIWKQILDQPIDILDLEKIDIHTANFLSDLMALEAKGITKEQFNYLYDQQFTTILSNGKEVEVQTGGKCRQVTFENVQEYVRLALSTRYDECSIQIGAIKAGFFEVISKDVALLINWKDLEERICGNLNVDVALLRKNTDYESWSSSDTTMTWFWKALESFSNEEKILYLKFVWGRSRLPLSSDGFDRKHKITRLYSSHPDISLPIAHTCFFTLDLPTYSSYEILYNKLLYAIKFCNEIDTDFTSSNAFEDL